MKAKTNFFHLFTILLLPLLIVGCKNEITDFNEYMRYLGDEDNGLLKKKEVLGLEYKVKYLPIDYLVQNDINKKSGIQKKSKKEITDSYKNNVSFLLTMGPGENEKFDITKLGVRNYEEYSLQMEILNFSMKEFISLKYGNETISPQIVHMENTYGLEKGRNFMISFSVDNNKNDQFLKNNDVKLIFNDELFGTGNNIFLFKKYDINKLPQLNC